MNNNIVLICGPSSTGKSASLRGLNNPEGGMYLNTEANKWLPFKSKFKEYNITDPLQIIEAINHAETLPDIHTIMIDSLTFMMDQYESTYVLNSVNTMQAWGEFAQFFKVLMQKHVAGSSKNVFFTAHTSHTLNEGEMVMETKVPVKGALKNNGIEAYFGVVIGTKRVSLKDLASYQSPYLNITEEEEMLGFKHVFQTRLTKGTINERIRAPMGMFSVQETFIDNNIQFLNERLEEYYKGE
jgi:hypothetical protein